MQAHGMKHYRSIDLGLLLEFSVQAKVIDLSVFPRIKDT
jgi:hypothetical protein